jgi:hypothetical protein
MLSEHLQISTFEIQKIHVIVKIVTYESSLMELIDSTNKLALQDALLHIRFISRMTQNNSPECSRTEEI